MEISKGEDLQGNLPIELSSPYKNFRDPMRNQVEQGIKRPKRIHPYRRVDISNLETRADTTKKIRRREKTRSSRRNFW